MSSIYSLPESTIRLLGSPLVVTTPVTLVKELLDNSIDAKATSVEVIISADTVKKIEVRDNGSGIHPDDYDALGRHGHTSKLRNFDELRNCSIKTLGFRGEALASANSLAQVTITTKIASEPVGATLHIHPNTGGVSKQQPTSAPVGTTVSIADLFSRLPIRKQVTTKESPKTLDKIRELLRSYAMARPQLRLSFKVLQSPKQSCSYSPKIGASVKETAIQLFGAELAAHCFEKTFEIADKSSVSSPSIGQRDSSPNAHYLFEAFMLKPDSDPSKVPKQHYFSVDGRPLTVKRGTMKKLLMIYVGHIDALRQGFSTTTLKDCFIRLDIKCPPGSYDANIEPSKDDVLFSDEETVLDGFKDMCKETYKRPSFNGLDLRLPLRCRTKPDRQNGPGAQEPPAIIPRTRTSSEAVTSPVPLREPPGEIVLEPSSSPSSQTQHLTTTPQRISAQLQGRDQGVSSPHTIDFTPVNAQVSATQNTSTPPDDQILKEISPNTRYTRCKVDMSTDLNEYSPTCPPKKRPDHSRELPRLQEKQDAVEYSAPRDVNLGLSAKMNTPNRNIGEQTLDDTVCQASPQLPIIGSLMTPMTPILHHTGAAPTDLDVPPRQRYLYQRESPCQLRRGFPGGPYRNPMLSTSEIAPQKATENATIQASLGPRRRRNYPPWSPPSSIERAEPIISRLADAGRGPTSDGMKQTTICFGDARGSRKRRRPQEDDCTVDDQGQQVQEIGDKNGLQRMFAVARQTLNHQLSQQEAQQNRVRPEAAQGQSYTRLQLDRDQEEASSSKIKEPIKTSLPDCDPRAYLLRRQKSIAPEEGGARPKKIRRLKSSLLPLENVPPDDQVHSLALVEVSSIEALRISVNQGALYDRYVERGEVVNGLKMSLDDGLEVEERLKTLLHAQKGLAGGEGGELEIGLRSVLKGKGTSTRV
ncbi:hypothetical protein F5Y06DRAFT_307023 [Hypoxylon sp. FL0890]|nr:hypothetical protein F5Y06DRAFT_307023 [Hypoxylon sp. FL0890]